MSQVSQSGGEAPEGLGFFVGSFLLESLTTGMYVEPRDCLREYVQNGMDAIEAARAARLLRPDEGHVRVIVSADDDTISIRDDGISIPAENVWGTLTSIGASKKALRRNAGFRGIGRLAGIAYCDVLEFRCKAAGEAVVSTLRFDAAAIRRTLREADTDVTGAFRSSISLAEPKPAPAGEHWTEVRMIGIAEAPEELVSVGLISEYLTSVAPLDYRSSWAGREAVAERARATGIALPTVQLSLGTREADLQQLFKPYVDTTFSGKKRSTRLTDVRFFEGGHTPGRRWWGWYADTPLYGQFADAGVAGMRVRVRNIQLDGTELMGRIFQKRGPSFARLTPWYVGEIFVEAVNVVPNARRDGFEDTPEWRDLSDEIFIQVNPLIDAAYSATRSRGGGPKTFARLDADIISQVDQLEVDAAAPAVDGGEVEAELEQQRAKATRSARARARGFVKRLAALDLDDYGEEEQLAIRETAARLREIGGDGAAIREARPMPPADARQYPEMLDTVFDVLGTVLDTRTFQKARRSLFERFSQR